MGLLESFINWIKKIAEPVIDLYNKDSNMFFIGAIILILILLIIVIVLARRAEESDDRPKKKIRYEDIDWSVDGEGDSEEAETAHAAKGRRAAKKAEEEEKEAPVEKTSVKEETPAQEPVPEKLPGLTPKEEAQLGAFDVPMWMTKHTISIDQANSMAAQEWIDQQLASRRSISQKIIYETERHAEEMGKLALEIPDEKLVCIVAHDGEVVNEPETRRAPDIAEENVFVVSGKEFDKYAEPEPVVTKHEPEAPEPEPAVIEPEPASIEPEPVVTEPEPAVAEPEPVVIEPKKEVPDLKVERLTADQITKEFESGTLAKILREAEELRASKMNGADSGSSEEAETASPVITAPDEPEVDGILGIDTGGGDDEVPSWDIRETLKRLEAMQNENESLAKDIGISEHDEEPEEPEPQITEKTEPQIPDEPTVPEILLRPNNFMPGDEELESNLKKEYEQMLRGEDAVASAAPSTGGLNDSIDIHTARVRRFGPNNRDTNRSGRKFTEEELIRQIRD